MDIKIRDSVCEGKSWNNRKFLQRFYQRLQTINFPTFFTFFF